VSAFACELQGRGTTNIAAGAGDQGDFPIELTHQQTSMTMFETNYRASVSRFTSRADHLL
jgi:hypothetical protein